MKLISALDIGRLLKSSGMVGMLARKNISFSPQPAGDLRRIWQAVEQHVPDGAAYEN